MGGVFAPMVLVLNRPVTAADASELCGTGFTFREAGYEVTGFAFEGIPAFLLTVMPGDAH